MTTDRKRYLEELRRGILDFIITTEQRMKFTRGPSLAEIVEWFADAEQGHAKAKTSIRGQLTSMCLTDGHVKRMQRPGLLPDAFYSSTEAGRLHWFTFRAKHLPMLHGTCSYAATVPVTENPIPPRKPKDVQETD